MMIHVWHRRGSVWTGRLAERLLVSCDRLSWFNVNWAGVNVRVDVSSSISLLWRSDWSSTGSPTDGSWDELIYAVMSPSLQGREATAPLPKRPRYQGDHFTPSSPTPPLRGPLPGQGCHRHVRPVLKCKALQMRDGLTGTPHFGNGVALLCGWLPRQLHPPSPDDDTRAVMWKWLSIYAGIYMYICIWTKSVCAYHIYYKSIVTLRSFFLSCSLSNSRRF